jgi:hypothetical protein
VTLHSVFRFPLIALLRDLARIFTGNN